MPRLKKMTPFLLADDEEWKKRIRLGEIMKSKKIRQYKLAEYLGVKQGTISNWKSGRTPMPSNYIYDICCYLDVTPDILFGFEKIEVRK